MIVSLYIERQSPLHRLGAAPKLVALAALGAGLFFIADPAIMAAVFAATLGLHVLARLPLRAAWSGLRPALWILAALALAQLWLFGVEAALTVSLRLAALIVAANLFTYTTRASALIDGVERWLRPLLGARAAEQTSLAIALTLRFAPMLMALAETVREAQAARGLDRTLIALATPLLIRTIQTADAVGEALEARGVGAAREDPS